MKFKKSSKTGIMKFAGMLKNPQHLSAMDLMKKHGLRMEDA
ncbi:MAG: hypothetical protein Q7S92_06815 [Candidatus Diapherotrites archaeon]|nr:hypothetical protein [Candidatus Diapherotrites archaeon]